MNKVTFMGKTSMNSVGIGNGCEPRTFDDLDDHSSVIYVGGVTDKFC